MTFTTATRCQPNCS